MEDKKFEVGDDGNGLEETRLEIIDKKIKELEIDKETNKVELTKLYQEKISLTVPQKDFKIAEIWIRDGRLMLEASKEFWLDKFRARGILKYCDDIVKEAEYKEDKPMVQRASWANFKNFVRGIKRKR